MNNSKEPQAKKVATPIRVCLGGGARRSLKWWVFSLCWEMWQFIREYMFVLQGSNFPNLPWKDSTILFGYNEYIAQAKKV